MAEPHPNLIAWIDTETTGKRPDLGLLLEVAVIITDNELNQLASHSRVIRHDRHLAYTYADEYVRQMHTRNGLFDELEDGVSQHVAEAELISLISTAVRDHGTGHGLPVVAGNSIGFDRKWLERHMPELNEDHLHYRNIDVSSIKECARRFAPHVLESAPSKQLGHRGRSDLIESIEEFRHYRLNGLFE